MQKFPRAHRVSIIVPLQRDEKQFEDTLLSVLENQPDDSQIIAAHNGTYNDPFELAGEIDFVTARSSNLVDLVRDAFEHTTAPIVHVLGTGLNAMEGWADRGLERFDDHRIAAVAPSIAAPSRGTRETSLWSDSKGRYCVPGRSRNSPASVSGFYLNACFVRRRLLGELLDAVAPAINDPIAVAYAFGCLLRRAKWSVEAANDCEVTADNTAIISDQSESSRGQCLAAIRNRIVPQLPTPGLGGMLSDALLGGGSIGELIGMLRHQSSSAAMRRAIDIECVTTVDDLAPILRMEENTDSVNRAA